MYNNECDRILDKVKKNLSDYLDCLSKNIIDDLLAAREDRISDEVRREIIAGFQKEISEDLRKEMHDLFEAERKSNQVLLAEKSNHSAIDQSSLSDVNKSATDDNMDIQEKDVLQIQKREVFYFGAPEKDLTFPETRVTKNRNNKTVFKFEMITDKEASITIVNDEITHKKMINAYDTYLKGTVKPSNTFSNEFTSIIVDEPGSAELKDGEWIIKDKIKVTFK